MTSKWTDQRVWKLMWLAERHTARECAEKLGLHPKTVANRLAVLNIKARTECMTLRECIRRTGYLKHQLYRAKKALNQRWLGAGKGRGHRLGIREDQLDAMCEWLRTEA